MLRCLFLIGVVLAALFAVSAPWAVAGDGPVVARATGSGYADFDVPWDPNYPETYFGLNAAVRRNGSARGTFICGIANLLHLEGPVRSGRMDADGSLTLTGTFNETDYDRGFFGPDAPLFIEDAPYTLQIWPGGPGVGKFAFTHPLGTDHETLTSGQLAIQPGSGGDSDD